MVSVTKLTSAILALATGLAVAAPVDRQDTLPAYGSLKVWNLDTKAWVGCVRKNGVWAKDGSNCARMTALFPGSIPPARDLSEERRAAGSSLATVESSVGYCGWALDVSKQARHVDATARAATGRIVTSFGTLGCFADADPYSITLPSDPNVQFRGNHEFQGPTKKGWRFEFGNAGGDNVFKDASGTTYAIFWQAD